jgi:hypothetical protein
MATIQEISQGSNYQGNAALGGFAPTAIDIDNKPLQTLAAYTVMFNKNQYDQRQKDTDNKIQELAELSKYDILGARGKDKDEAIRSYQKLQESMRQYAMRGVPKSPQEKLQQEIELKTNIKEATDKIKSLNARGIKYNKLLNDINGDATTNAEEKRLFKDELDQNFNNTDWKTPISDLEKYTFEMPKVGDAAMGKTTTSVDVGNQIVQQTVEFFDMQKTMDNSIAEGSGFTEFNTLPPNATEEQKKQFARRKAKGGGVKILNDATGLLNEALQSDEYKNQDGTINTQAVLAKNKMAGNILLGIDRYNQYATEMKEAAIKGVYTTKLGKKIDLKNIISADKIFLIDKNKPLTTEQVIFIDKFLRAAPDKEEEKIIETGEAISKQNANTSAFNAWTSRINANKPSGSGGDGGGTSTAGSDQAALIFGTHINTLKNNFANNGNTNVIVSYNGTDPITRKALGLTEEVDADGKKTGGFVTYRPDGTAMVNSNEDGSGGTPLTIEQLKFSFVTAVKGGSKDEAQLDAKFIEEQENGFKGIFRTTSGSQIWNGWGQGAAPATTTPAPAAGQKTKTVGGKKLILPN